MQNVGYACYYWAIHSLQRRQDNGSVYFLRTQGLPGNSQTAPAGVLVDLITNKGVDTFYVGSQGRFDAIVRSVLRELEKEYPEIHYAVVLAYLPGKKNEYDDFSDAILPEGIEAVHPHYAISWRNRWMLQRSDYVVTYITHPWGGAAKFAEKAKWEGKTMVNLFCQ